MDDLKLRLLTDISQELLHLSPDSAKRMFALGTLPIPAFRIGNQKRGPLYVHMDDLEKHINQIRKRALQQTQQMENAK